MIQDCTSSFKNTDYLASLSSWDTIILWPNHLILLSLIYNIASDLLVTKSEDLFSVNLLRGSLQHFVSLIFLWNPSPFLTVCCHFLQPPFCPGTPTQIHPLVLFSYSWMKTCPKLEVHLCPHTMEASLGGQRLLRNSLFTWSCAMAEGQTHLLEKALPFYAQNPHLFAPPCAPGLCGRRGAPFFSPQKAAKSASRGSVSPNLRSRASTHLQKHLLLRKLTHSTLP